jgi:hypothetical protein
MKNNIVFKTDDSDFARAIEEARRDTVDLNYSKQNFLKGCFAALIGIGIIALGLALLILLGLLFWNL